LELDRSLILNERVMPACLPTRVYPPNSELYISGWGQVRGEEAQWSEGKKIGANLKLKKRNRIL
jgi:hypothetical protein